MTTQTLPSVTELASEVYSVGQYLKRNFRKADLTERGTDFVGTDCRLRVFEDSWQLLTGDSSYDQDHRGEWSSGSIPWGCTRQESREIAENLLDNLE